MSVILKEYINIYVDGCSLGNPGKSGYGAILTYKKRRKEIYGPIRHATNNAAEIIAAIKGLEAILIVDRLINIYSDSQYVVYTMTKGWKRKANLPLWSKLEELVAKHKEVNFEWISRDFNTEADRLAKLGAQMND